MGYVVRKLASCGMWMFGYSESKEKTANGNGLDVDAEIGLKTNKLKRIDDNLTYLLNDLPEYQGIINKPLVVIVAWLTATEGHLEKYRDLYIARGFDCVTVRIKLLQTTTPITGSQVVARNLLDFLVQVDYDEIVVHAFSIGAYLFAEAMVIINNNPEKYGKITEKVKGLVLDSAIDYCHMPIGFSRAMSTNPVGIKFVQWMVKLCMHVCYKTILLEYKKACKMLRSNEYFWPRLIYISKDDALHNYDANEKLCTNWKSMGIDVQWKCWEHSAHVQHFCNYPEEYIQELDTFLRKINIGCVDGQFSGVVIYRL